MAPRTIGRHSLGLDASRISSNAAAASALRSSGSATILASGNWIGTTPDGSILPLQFGQVLLPSSTIHFARHTRWCTCPHGTLTKSLHTLSSSHMMHFQTWVFAASVFTAAFVVSATSVLTAASAVAFSVVSSAALPLSARDESIFDFLYPLAVSC